MSNPLSRRHVSRRALLGGLGAGAVWLLAACGGAQPAAPAKPTEAAKPAQTTQPQAAKPGTGALNGTKLSLIVGTFYVPDNNKQLDDLAAQLGKETGMEIKVDRTNEGGTKVAAALESGVGGDAAIMTDFDAHKYGDKLTDMSDIAKDLDSTWEGWYDVAKQACIVDGKWRALMIGQAPAAWNWRTDMFKEAGVEKFPDTFDALLEAAKKLKAKGTPVGMTLGQAPGDGRSTNYPVLYAFGGKEFETDGKTVAINSAETVKAIEWYVEMFKQMDPGVTAWLDPDNNQAFLAGKVAATVNVNTIYLAAKADAAKGDAAKQKLIEVMDHANWPAGPAGRFATYNINIWAGLANSKNREGQYAWMKAWFDPKFLIPWTKTGNSYFIPAFKRIEKEDVWPTDPKLAIFRELNKLNRLPGYAGPPGRPAAEAVSKFIVVNMFAKAVTGELKPKEAAAWAEKEYKDIAK
jgi:multiple sugar transport system substrate-binding protein